MKLSLVCFTENGSLLCERLTELLRVENYEILESGRLEGEGIKEWTKRQFETAGGVIFIGAAGIAVRSIAPFIMSKDKDLAVVAVDESGKFSISLLSGHLGGANELAGKIAKLLGAMPVITTATDLNNKFAVDNFAKRNGLAISDITKIKKISSQILNGRTINLYSDFPVSGKIPEELKLCGEIPEIVSDYGIWITLSSKENEKIIRLIPPVITLGIGCKKGSSEELVEKKINEFLEKHFIAPEAVFQIASIDLKSEEDGIISYADRHNIKFKTASEKELNSIKGEFTDSEFVRKITGVGNVCERAAMWASQLADRDSRLLIKKYAGDGVTLAAAVRQWKGII